MPDEERRERNGEEAAVEAEAKPKGQPPFTRVGFLILLIALVVQGTALYFYLKGAGPLAVPLDEKKVKGSKEDLRYPKVELKGLAITKRIGPSETKTMMMSFTFYFGRTEQEKDVKIPVTEMNEYNTYLTERLPWVRNEIRKHVMSSEFQDITTSTWQNTLTSALQRKINEELFVAHGLKRRVKEVCMDPIIYD